MLKPCIALFPHFRPHFRPHLRPHLCPQHWGQAIAKLFTTLTFLILIQGLGSTSIQAAQSSDRSVGARQSPRESALGLSFELEPLSVATPIPSPPAPLPPAPPIPSDLNLAPSAPLQSNPQIPRSEPPRSQPPKSEPPRSQSASASPQTATSQNGLPRSWWQQGSDSPIAIAIGVAEGTRTVNGDRTSAYYWHRDPGNGADNYGTFSYQHLPPNPSLNEQPTPSQKRQLAAQQNLPDQADRAQLKKLQQFEVKLLAQAAAQGLKLSPKELLNGLDLANQSEAAALLSQGYIDRLHQIKTADQASSNPASEQIETDQIETNQIETNQIETDQIIEARVWSYWHPQRQAWDAPGLGNTYDSIRADQSRRVEAIAGSLVAQGYDPSNLDFSGSDLASTPSPHTLSHPPQSEAIANQIIFHNR